MKALSLSRPWPYAILHLGKRVENRIRKDGRMPSICKHRGPLLLHAAKSWDDQALQWMADRGLTPAVALDDRNSNAWRLLTLPGALFGRCRAVGHIEPVGARPPQRSLFGPREPHASPKLVLGDEDPRYSGKPGAHMCGGPPGTPTISATTSQLFDYARSVDMRWWMGGYALILDDVEPLPKPIPCRGMLGLWTPSPDVLAQLEATDV